ncbi:SDR family oxidoreductase [Nitriliruptoraceae bacterium ZYF776]|nr:SDR family oxidoreductase [Profundirhabdus halotolerans]
MRVLVLGATGYIGGRLVPELLARGHEVRCGARTPAKLDGRPWRDDVEVVEADVFDRATLDPAVAGCDAVYYLVHSMDGSGSFEERDRRAAATVRDACADGGVGRIVYLGGLGREGEDLSEHLRSRHEVGRELADGPVPVTELRAAIIIGSGSASFEMLRHLVEVLPVMTTPRWVDTRCQPIAVRDVLAYLCGVLEEPRTAGRVLEIGGPDVLTYREMMQTYAEVAGLRRRTILPVPVLTPGLSSLWVGLVTPLPTGLARPLVGSLVNEVVVHDPAIRELVPRDPIPFRDALCRAMQRIQDLDVATTWASAGRLGTGTATARVGTEGDADVRRGGDVPEDPQPDDPSWSGGTVLTDERTVHAAASPEAVFRSVCGIGGARGYRSAGALWAVRGHLDKLVGGIGLRRGRRHPHDLSVGEVVDFWRVEALEPPRLLRLRAEMRVPGEAWLEFRIAPEGDGTRLEQRARFHPRGLWGRLYWAVLVPFHRLIFPRMARRLAADAERGLPAIVERGATGEPAPTGEAEAAAPDDLTERGAPGSRSA